MHYLVQHGKVRSQVINVPKGLPELLSDITREVLRCQPETECLCQFIIDYLNSVIMAQHKAQIAKSVVDRALRVVDDAIADMCICDIPKEKADYMCEAMEECFRRFLAQRRCETNKTKEVIKFNEFDMLDELMKKCKFTENELKISKPLIEATYQKFVNAYMAAKDSSEGTQGLYEYFREREVIRLNERLKEEAAIKIQSHFRGFLIRKSLFMEKPIQKPTPLILENEYNKMEMAALKIQQFFRRHFKSTEIAADEEEEFGEEELQDAWTPAPTISLTSHSNDGQEALAEIYNENETQHENITNEVISTGQDDQAIEVDQNNFSTPEQLYSK